MKSKFFRRMFSRKMLVVFTTRDAGKLLKAKENIEAAGIVDYRVVTGDNTSIQFAGPVLHKIKVFKKDVSKAKEALKAINREGR
ncbi:hypothetical protein [Pseudalkalibacillus sp. SCS-8]|uniref:hypothetical protein n=1 Tax=Pseudalkalibacillus nanhaiensis TaxID=3115291 RepID=UPI0032DB7DB6